MRGAEQMDLALHLYKPDVATVNSDSFVARMYAVVVFCVVYVVAAQYL